ncbi:MAG: PKD domain-containing protein [Flavobacteriales bacterium]|nr:PKD domain-containing protein [Flavobacteriales bacterium]
MNATSVTRSRALKFVFKTVLPVLATAAIYTGISGCGNDNIPPKAEFIALSTSITAGQSVTFSDESEDNGYDIQYWEWTFEGGTPATSTERNPIVVYAVVGVYDVTLSVGNSLLGNTMFKPNYITVTAAPDLAPTAQFTASVTELYEGGNVNFTDQSTSTPTSWAWTFEGGTPATSTVQNPTGIVYANPGAYDVTLVATNANGSNTLLKSEYILVLQNVPYCSPVTDIDGNTYQVVEIGSHCWMASNLRTTTYNNGVPIPTGLDSATWVNTSAGAYTILDNNASYATSLGRLYNWYAATSSNGICPDGWHLPNDAEWTDLMDALGGINVAAPALKSATGWTLGNATGSSGFNAPNGGSRYDFNFAHDEAAFWSSVPMSATDGGIFLMYNLGEDNVWNWNTDKNSGISCRCVKD